MELNHEDIIENVLEGYIFSEKKVTDECKIYTIENSTGCG
ncbi:TPA: AraC family transcriptional regulator, partial [Streptococcus pyogenes]|nr:AraC family transcriptional regulator [Streptococcus pyogenes]